MFDFLERAWENQTSCMTNPSEQNCALAAARAAITAGTLSGRFPCRKLGCSVELIVYNGKIIGEKATETGLCQDAITRLSILPASQTQPAEL